MKQSNNASPGIFQRCPHLGLQDDPSTSLAYPSTWNYCYHANPPGSVVLQHQEAVCLTAAHRQCPVLLHGASAPLPSALLGVHEIPGAKRSRRTRTLLLLGLILAFSAGAFIVKRTILTPMSLPLSTVTSLPSNTALPSETPTETVYQNPAQDIIASFTADASTRIAGYTSTPLFTGTPPTATATMKPTRTPLPTHTSTQTRVPSATFTLLPTRSSTPVPPPANGVACGYSLDTPFGGPVKFLLHRILPGENLTVYSETYGTTTDAILAVNYRLPLPVWTDWVLVIPYHTSNVAGLPPFEPYQGGGERLSIEELAHQLNADPVVLSLYNNFQQPCGTFNGWLLVPRSSP